MVLRPYLLALTEGHGPDEQLITRKSLHTGKKADRYWLMRETRRLCAEAEPPKGVRPQPARAARDARH